MSTPVIGRLSRGLRTPTVFPYINYALGGFSKEVAMQRSRESRLSALENQLDPSAVWLRTDGLSSLLAAAEALGLPQRDAWDMPDLEEEGPFGRLLAEARALAKAQEPQP
jgi:hypothetical protein